MTKNIENGKKVWVDPDDAPELDNNFFQMSDLWKGDKLIKKGKGRPKQVHTKKSVTIRIDEDVLDAFKKEGDGWQTRINSFLRNYLPS